MLIAAEVNPGYSQRRDYVSSLSAHGAERPWLGIAAIIAFGVAGLGAALLVRRLSRLAAVAFLAAGAGYVVAALARVDCPSGAARCGISRRRLGGRFDVRGSETITHWSASIIATAFVLAGLLLIAARLYRGGRRAAAVATLAAATATLVALLATGGQHPGTVQRIWILAITAWLVGAAVAGVLSHDQDRT